MTQPPTTLHNVVLESLVLCSLNPPFSPMWRARTQLHFISTFIFYRAYVSVSASAIPLPVTFLFRGVVHPHLRTSNYSTPYTRLVVSTLLVAGMALAATKGGWALPVSHNCFVGVPGPCAWRVYSRTCAMSVNALSEAILFFKCFMFFFLRHDSSPTHRCA